MCNIETGLVTSFSYSLCKETYDQRYLIPDEAFALPIMESMVELNAELFDHWDSYKSVTSRTINTGFDLFGRTGGKFSKDYQWMKSNQFNEKAFTMRTELRHHFYSVKQFILHPTFKLRLLEIASFMRSNDSASADHAAQLLIRDYGTHYLVNVDVGAVIIKEDNVRAQYIANPKGNTDSDCYCWSRFL